MEPRSRERGSLTIDIQHPQLKKLQWSRVHVNAEVGATFREAIDNARLQWSRVHVNAEVSAHAAFLNGADWASMEPRSRERGSRHALKADNIIGRLQWSRVHVNAEVSVPICRWKSRAMLQWSRVHVNAEVWPY